MNKKTRTIVDASWYVVCFLMIQLICNSVGVLIWKDFVLNPLALTVTLTLSSVITIGLYWWRKWWTESAENVRKVNIAVYLMLCLFAVCCVIPSASLLELMGVEADETQERIMMEIMQSPISFLVIALLVPITEEIVFRGALLRLLLDYFKGGKEGDVDEQLPASQTTNLKGVVYSILISAVLFGIVHGNIAQFFHATLVGTFLGWLYYKTRSIVPGVFLHFANNTLVFIIAKFFPKIADQHLLETFGGNYPIMISVMLICILMLVALIVCLNKVLKA